MSYQSVKVPTFRLKNDVQIYSELYGNKTLAAGTFVKPINKGYLPSHIKDTKQFLYYDDKSDIFAYTSMGIVLIARNEIEEC